jgi:copper chaperone CopZ
MSQLRVRVEGMSCRHCVREVTAKLRDVPGVETLAADARSNEVALGGTMTENDVVSALEGLSYRVRVLP